MGHAGTPIAQLLVAADRCTKSTYRGELNADDFEHSHRADGAPKGTNRRELKEWRIAANNNKEKYPDTGWNVSIGRYL
jgi:hypothetical protein